MKHLKADERAVIAHLLSQKHSIREIARQLGRSHTTISREVKRNGSKTTEYKGETAQKRYHTRLRKRQEARRKLKEDDLWIFCSVLDCTLFTLTQASNILFTTRYSCRRSRMYQLIRENKRKGGTLWHSLPFSAPLARFYPAKSSKMKWQEGRKRIEERPAIVETLSEIGHWEVDTIHSKAHKGGVLTLVERASLKVKACIISDLKANTVSQCIVHLLQGEIVHTITSDNGREFECWREVEAKLNCQFYFARPYRSNDRARNERMNREIRRFFPKGTDFLEVESSWFEHVIHRINKIPKAIFRGLSAEQKYESMAA